MPHKIKTPQIFHCYSSLPNKVRVHFMFKYCIITCITTQTCIVTCGRLYSPVCCEEVSVLVVGVVTESGSISVNTSITILNTHTCKTTSQVKSDFQTREGGRKGRRRGGRKRER